MAEEKFNLFGLSPEEIRRKGVAEAREQGLRAAGVGRGRGGVALANSLGGILTQMFDVGGQQAAAQARRDALKNAYETSKDDPDNY